MFGKEGVPQLILVRFTQRFVGRECTIVLLGQKVISQWSAIRPPGREQLLIVLLVEPLVGRSGGSRSCPFLLRKVQSSKFKVQSQEQWLT